ncbi:hypothetical protein BDV98DRAFT_570195 [Pterulicium gracile]|uniref:DUF159-domain-containing protein n=1 Tax=Pterulicium gracile TaxID=1884261 RepID=A0A5C3QCR4_9AGAR|nr:hypothetical protein BDV98DRAFT_570195 [Pterula gracilis]
MCGRFALALSHRKIRDGLARDRNFDEELEEWIDEERLTRAFNIAPRSHAPVIRRRYDARQSTSELEDLAEPSEPAAPSDANIPASTEDPSDDAGEPELPDPSPAPLVLHTMKWGVVPHWSKYEDTALNTTNARSENLVAGGGMWNSMKGKKRCVVVCQGYYEWLKKGRDKIPHFTRHKEPERLLLLAGLYDSVVLTGETEPLYTFAIVTTDAAKEFSWLHDRQPVILADKKAVDMWLDTGDTIHTSASAKSPSTGAKPTSTSTGAKPTSTSNSTAKPTSKSPASTSAKLRPNANHPPLKNGGWTDALTELVKPYRENKAHPLDCYQVPKEVGKVGTESETFIHPVKNRKDGIEAMFGRMKRGERAIDTSISASGAKREDSSGPSKSSPKEGLGKEGLGKDKASEGKEREKKESQRAANLNSNLSSASPSPDPPPGPGEGKKRKRPSPRAEDGDDSDVEVIDVDDSSDPRVPRTPKLKYKQSPTKPRTTRESPTRSPGKKQKVVIDVDAEPSKKITKFFGKK